MMKNFTHTQQMVLLLLCFYATQLLSKEPQNLISSIHVTQNSITIEPHPAFKEKYLREDFFVTYHDASINLQKMNYSITSLPFILNVVSIVWLSGQTYYVDEMDRQLYDSLKTIHTIFQILYPRTQWNGELKAHKLVDNQFDLDKPANTHAALLFSHGLDSMCSSFLHADKKQLLLTAYGHFDTPLGQEDIWEGIRKKVVDYAHTYGHDYQFFESNYHTFLNTAVLDHASPEIWNWRLQAVEGLGWAGLVAPVLIHTGYQHLLIASSFTWDFSYAYAATPLIDDNIQFAGISVTHDAFELSRAQKCIYLATQYKKLGIPDLPIRVCGKNAGCANCSKCGKCLRTIIGFLLVNVSLKDFGFDISQYEACARVKEYLYSMKWMFDYVKWIWVDAQQIAQSQQEYIPDIELRNFFTWFKHYDLQNIPIHPKHSVIQWAKLAPFHKKIPPSLITKRPSISHINTTDTACIF